MFCLVAAIRMYLESTWQLRVNKLIILNFEICICQSFHVKFVL